MPSFFPGQFFKTFDNHLPQAMAPETLKDSNSGNMSAIVFN